jgi:hypothetical protein
VIQRRERFRFALKARDAFRVRDEERRQDLERNLPIAPAPRAERIS